MLESIAFESTVFKSAALESTEFKSYSFRVDFLPN